MLAHLGELAKLYADPTRLRLLKLLERDELSVAEIAQVLDLAQPRVSTHLAKLREAGLVIDRRAGVQAYYRLADHNPDAAANAIWAALSAHASDPALTSDLARLDQLLASRAAGQTWADQVAGDMERHYSPGRTWAGLGRALTQLVELGDVLDIASGDGLTAELLAPRAGHYVLIDQSERVVSAARARLAHLPQVQVLLGDMHALPQPDACFDQVLMLQALPYSAQPALAVAEAARVLRPGGILLISALQAHADDSVQGLYGHRNLGFSLVQLHDMLHAAGLHDVSAQAAVRERRPPHFQTLTLSATR